MKKANKCFVCVAIMLIISCLSSCESGFNQMSFDDASDCIVSKRHHNFKHITVWIFYNDSINDTFDIDKKEGRQGKERICLRNISNDYSITYVCFGKNKIRKYFRVRPNCKYRVENLSYSAFLPEVLFLYTDSVNNLYEDSHPYEYELLW